VVLGDSYSSLCDRKLALQTVMNAPVSLKTSLYH